MRTTALLFIMLCQHPIVSSAQQWTIPKFHISLNSGISQAKGFQFDTYFSYVTSKKFTFTAGVGGFSIPDKFEKGNFTPFISCYATAGKILPVPGSNNFFHIQAGPSYTAEIILSGSGKQEFAGCRVIASANFKILKFLYFETGINGQFGRYTSAGLFGGIRLK